MALRIIGKVVCFGAEDGIGVIVETGIGDFHDIYMAMSPFAFSIKRKKYFALWAEVSAVLARTEK